MKALPLWQPWASLVALEAKRVETRSWPAPASVLGKRIAIHATKTTQHLAAALDPPFADYIDDPEQLPLGAIIATAVVDRCRPITEQSAEQLANAHPNEFAFGLYEPGRFAWVLRDVEALAEPVPFKGAQGLFEIPDDLLAGATA